jgi:hypothetical protein
MPDASPATQRADAFRHALNGARTGLMEKRGGRTALIAAIVAVSLAVRATMYHYQSLDYDFFVHRWYDYINANGGFPSKTPVSPITTSPTSICWQY